jgi:integrase
MFSASVKEFLEFLFCIYQGDNLGYSAVNTARSAVSTVLMIDNVAAGQHPLVCRFLKGVYNQKPALPRYTATWDVSDMINYIRRLSPVSQLNLKQLTQKLLMLCLILSGQRGQTMHLLDVRNMSLTYSRASFAIGDVIKTTRPGHHVNEISFLAYAPDRRLCVVTALKHYLERTLDIRGSVTQLFVTLKKPHKAASRDTLRRWARDTLAAAGVNMAIFKPHSVRSASTSFAAKSKLSMDTIMRAAGWHQETTFSKYYNMPVRQNFGQHILDNAD